MLLFILNAAEKLFPYILSSNNSKHSRDFKKRDA